MFVTVPTLADEANFSGTLTGRQTYINPSYLPDASMWGVSGEGEFGLGAGVHTQVNAGYSHLSDSGVTADNWNVGGAAYWKGDIGRAGAVVNYSKVDLSILGAHATNYGVFGEYFANEYFTFGVKAGGYDGDVSGAYVGAAMTGYVFPDFAITGAINYTHLNHAGAETNLHLDGEYLISEETPVAAFAGYTYSDLSNDGGHLNTFMVGLRYYFNTDGFASLTERQRSGTVGAIGTFGLAGLSF
jgi:hypothetical protein